MSGKNTVVSYRMKGEHKFEQFNFRYFISKPDWIIVREVDSEAEIYLKGTKPDIDSYGVISNVVKVERKNDDLIFLVDPPKGNYLDKRTKELEKKFPDTDADDYETLTIRCEACWSADFGVHLNAYNELMVICHRCGRSVLTKLLDDKTIYDEFEKKSDSCNEIEL